MGNQPHEVYVPYGFGNEFGMWADEITNINRELNCIIIHLGDLGKLVLKMNQEIKELQKLHTERVSQ